MIWRRVCRRRLPLVGPVDQRGRLTSASFDCISRCATSRPLPQSSVHGLGAPAAGLAGRSEEQGGGWSQQRQQLAQQRGQRRPERGRGSGARRQGAQRAPGQQEGQHARRPLQVEQPAIKRTCLIAHTETNSFSLHLCVTCNLQILDYS